MSDLLLMQWGPGCGKVGQDGLHQEGVALLEEKFSSR